ncbi:MAG: AMP-binding protein [Acidimicrobiales bacterium]|nr:AMP-binding protein [Acidimicrobiales bacterium]
MAVDLASIARETSDELAAAYLEAGYWDDQTLGELVLDRAMASPALPVRVWSDDHPADLTLGELADDARRFAGGLDRLGIRPGDVVAYQLPNWRETLTVMFGGMLAGVVLVPIVHFYGPREVDFILRQSGARALITVDRWGGVEQAAQVAAIRDGLPDLEYVVVVPSAERGGDGDIRFADLLDGVELTAPADVDPDHPAIIAYTSGTTADPKGVMHSHRGMMAELRQQAGASFARSEPMLNASPLAHMAGMLGGALQPLFRREEIHQLDRWDPGRVLGIVESAGLRPGGGPPIYITSLLDHPSFGDVHRSHMTVFGMGGAPIPASVAERAEANGIRPWAVYGSTEHPSITQASPDDSAYVRTRTTGKPRPGVEVRLVQEDGSQASPGEPGEILSRGPDLFCGYTDPELTAAAVDEHGWYHTGDIGVLDGDGNLTITDRLGDLIIRGGRNVSGTEIESHLLEHTSIAETAVVAAPDARLGETACAIIRLHPGETAPTLLELRDHLQSRDVPKQKWPESVRVVDEFPRTPSGKIRKNQLRAEIRSASPTQTPSTTHEGQT